MKKKVLAGILALFFGWLGVHRFYLDQKGLGIAYLILMLTGISFLLSFIDAILLLSMDQEAFDRKYNAKYTEGYQRQRGFDERNSGRRKYNKAYYKGRRPDSNQTYQSGKTANRRASTIQRPVANPYRDSGVRKFKEYDFDAAISDFEKALTVNPNDVAVHFNLACAYSITEQKDQAFEHLDLAVKNGFKDFNRIMTHDALAFLRIQDEFDAFKANQYRLTSNSVNLTENIPQNDDLLEQLQKLADLREKGLLTKEEFDVQKRRLLG